MSILIKRYANRKLYNTETSRYITLKGIEKLLDEGLEVHVIDNETGEDITQVALSQILVDNKRANEDPSDTLLSQILARGGDALYGAIRKSVDDATEGLGEFQDRFRRIVQQSEPGFRHGLGLPWERRSNEADSRGRHENESRATGPGSDPQAMPSTHELESMIRKTVTESFEALDLPTRRDLEALMQKLDSMTDAIERFGSTCQGSDDERGRVESDGEPD